MNKIKLLYTEIGRGHPFYLDGIVDEINRCETAQTIYSKSTIFDHASGLDLKTWQLVRYLYSQSGKTNIVSKLYKMVRQKNDYESNSLILKILGYNLKREFQNEMSPLIVAHPILVSILRYKTKLYYQHGELITPKESVVSGAEKVFVPTDSAGIPFLDKYRKEQIIVTGLCIEPSIERIATDAYNARLERYNAKTSLTGCFISSGAEPDNHVAILVNSIISHLKAKGRAMLFVKKGGLLEKSINQRLSEIEVGILKINSLANLPHELPPFTIIQYSNRRDENKFTSHFFRYFDFFMSPSHERSNWAVGLGLPMFITEPAIGPYSPLNRQFLLKSETAVSINDINEANIFALQLKKLHINLKLKRMAVNGWGKYQIDGFKKIVIFFDNLFR